MTRKGFVLPFVLVLVVLATTIAGVAYFQFRAKSPYQTKEANRSQSQSKLTGDDTFDKETPYPDLADKIIFEKNNETYSLGVDGSLKKVSSSPLQQSNRSGEFSDSQRLSDASIAIVDIKRSALISYNFVTSAKKDLLTQNNLPSGFQLTPHFSVSKDRNSIFIELYELRNKKYFIYQFHINNNQLKPIRALDQCYSLADFEKISGCLFDTLDGNVIVLVRDPVNERKVSLLQGDTEKIIYSAEKAEACDGALWKPLFLPDGETLSIGGKICGDSTFSVLYQIKTGKVTNPPTCFSSWSRNGNYYVVTDAYSSTITIYDKTCKLISKSEDQASEYPPDVLIWGR